MTTKVKVSSKNQIVVPHQIREKYHIMAGQQLLIEADEHGIYLMPEPADWANYMRAAGQKEWQKSGGGEKVIKSLRKEWDEKRRIQDETIRIPESCPGCDVFRLFF